MSTEPTQEAAFFSTIRSWGIVRSDQRVFGGVLGGVGARIGMAPGPTRILFVLAALFTGGLAALVYAAAWALLPDAEGRIIIQDFGRGTPNVGALVAIGVLTLLGFIGLDNIGPGNWWGAWGNFDSGFFDNNMNIFPRLLMAGAILVPIAVVAGIVWVIVWSVRQGRSDERAAQGYARMPDGTIPQPQAPVPAAATAEDVEAQVAADIAVAETPDAPTGTSTTAAFAAAPVATTYAPPVYSAPVPKYSPKPRVPGPGKFGYLAALAMIPLSAAITLYLHTSDQLAVWPGIAMGMIWTAGLGLILIINALRGRKAGFLGFVSVLTLIPVGLAIGYADEIRDHYDNNSGRWYEWNGNEGWSDPVVDAEPIVTPEPFDAAAAFTDYETVAIAGTCYATDNSFAPDASGTIRLSAVTADQTITVTSMDTRLQIPQGTSLNIVATGGTDGAALASIAWEDRDLSCDVQNVGAPAVQLVTTDAPVLTVELDDTMTDGYMTLWIEEN